MGDIPNGRGSNPNETPCVAFYSHLNLANMQVCLNNSPCKHIG